MRPFAALRGRTIRPHDFSIQPNVTSLSSRLVAAIRRLEARIIPFICAALAGSQAGKIRIAIFTIGAPTILIDLRLAGTLLIPVLLIASGLLSGLLTILLISRLVAELAALVVTWLAFSPPLPILVQALPVIVPLAIF